MGITEAIKIIVPQAAQSKLKKETKRKPKINWHKRPRFYQAKPVHDFLLPNWSFHFHLIL